MKSNPCSDDAFRGFLLRLDNLLKRELLGAQHRGFLQSLNVSARWQDPAYRARASESQKAAWRRRRERAGSER
jgi:hypothetical protein